jgi:hypothetical protein
LASSPVYDIYGQKKKYLRTRGEIKMKEPRVPLFAALIWLLLSAAFSAPATSQSGGAAKNLEPYRYEEDFETNELNAWASYPLWQDTAFDPNFHVGTIVPGDPNISIVQRVTPYTHVDNYTGAQKKLEMLLLPGSSIRLRYYLKSERKPEFLKIRLAAGDDGVIDFTIPDPAANRWERVGVSYDDLTQQNAGFQGRTIRVWGLAVLAKIPLADPATPIYFGLDDIVIDGARTPEFRFIEPAVDKLREWKPFIARRHYRRGESLRIRGEWPVEADRVSLRLVDFTRPDKTLLESGLKKSGGEWQHPPLRLDWPEGFYVAELCAYQKLEKIAATELSIFIAPQDLAGRHPRLWFDSQGLECVQAHLREDRFKSLADDIRRSAAEARKNLPLDTVVFDIDVFPKDEPLLGNVPRSIYPWFERIRPWRAGSHANSLAFALLGDQEAGRYAKELIVRLCGFPAWLHPWFESRGQHIYYPVGELGMDVALAYDLVYDLLSESERKVVRDGLWRNVVRGCHRSYVEDNLVTSNTSNWVAHITGGSLMSQAAIYGDGENPQAAEPFLSGLVFKLHELIQKSLGRDGGYGESYGYCRFTMESLSKALPALANVFKTDLSGPLDRTYQDLVWATLLDQRYFFYFGDSGGNLGPMTNWAFLLGKRQDPLLGWLYHFFKQEETLMDVIYETEAAPRRDPFEENPVRAFWDLGTTVFRSGWQKDDFLFVLRTGAFYNHQHLDQGTFWLADRGSVFIEERHGSTYYDDPIYQSHYTQPEAHSTILIDHNAQSQRVGDPLRFIPGFNDHAFIHHFLDGEKAAFVSGDIGRLYWGKVKGLRRNVLYLKPRTLLLLDAISPDSRDVDVTLLFQTAELKDIQAGGKSSIIHKGNTALHLAHLWPENLSVQAEETPLYINTLKTEKPLVREGMLTVTARTEGKPLVMANLLTTTAGEENRLETAKGDGCVFGRAGGQEFVFSVALGQSYRHRNWQTDALALTWSDATIFAALCTSLDGDGRPLVRSDEPLSCEITAKRITYFLAKPSEVAVGLEAAPRGVLLGGKKLMKFDWDSGSRLLRLKLPAGAGILEFVSN